MLVASAAAVKAHGLTPLARVHKAIVTAGDPVIMLEEPIPATARIRARAGMTIDGKASGADHATDTDPEGRGVLRQDRLYQLVRQHGLIVDRTVRVEFARPGVQAYSLTFG